MSNFITELKRRNVFKAALAYLVVSWLLLQVFSIVLPSIGAPDWVMRTVMLIIAIGFPIWLFFSWVYEMTPEGIKKTSEIDEDISITAKTNKRLNVLILVALTAVMILLFIGPQHKLIKTDDGKYAIAVLPFEDLTSEGDSEWFGTGVTEDILTHLSRIKDLRVISRTSVMQYKNHEKSIPEIAEELGVSYVVEGSIRKQGDRVLVAAQLINAEDTHLWADNYNENLNDVFEIQQAVSKRIVEQLKIVISPEDEDVLSTSSTTNREAYQLFLRGRTLADTRKKEDLEKSITYYEQAIALDPNYADAYAEIANSIFVMMGYGQISRNENIAKSRDYIKKALAINPNTVRAYTVMAQLYKMENNWDLAKENYEKAIAINPNDATAHHHFAIYFRDKQPPDHQKELEHISKAQQLDPLSFPINAVKTVALIRNEMLDEAEQHLDKKEHIIGLDPATNQRSMLYSIKKKDLNEYINVYKEALNKEPKNTQHHIRLSFGYSSILKDHDSAINHCKMAFDLSPSRGSASEYLYNLIYDKKYDEAEDLMEDPKFKSIFTDPDIIYHWYAFYAFKGEYEKAQDYLEEYKVFDSISYQTENIWLLSSMGRKDKVLDMLNNRNTAISEFLKVQIYANLKMRDSMYHYLDKYTFRNDLYGDLRRAMSINDRPEVDPYRNEPRYKAFLKANYLPVIEE